MYRLIAASLGLMCALAQAQVTGTPRTITASGQGQVAVQPDQARIQIAIVTRGATADAASQQNATTATEVFAALRQLIGSTGEIRTSYYNVSPYSEGSPPRQAGFQVTNAVQVIVNNLSITGKVIDTAISAGATRVDSLSLGLRDDEPIRLQALRAAGQKARLRAEAVATGLGVRIGQVLHANEGSVSVPVMSIDTRLAAAAPTTPIEAGSLNVTATVTVAYEILP